MPFANHRTKADRAQDKQNARCLDNIDKNLFYDLLITLLFPLNISLWMVRYISNLKNIFWNQFRERHVVFTTKKEIIEKK